MFRIVTLNANGIRSAGNKGLFRWLRRTEPDVVCLQEVKAHEGDIPDVLRATDLFHAHFHCAEKKGYSGTALYAVKQPRSVRTFGSSFKNPPGAHAGRLVEAAGLKGERRGGAEISAVHANFLMNLGDATTADVLALMAFSPQPPPASVVRSRFAPYVIGAANLCSHVAPNEVREGVRQSYEKIREAWKEMLDKAKRERAGRSI